MSLYRGGVDLDPGTGSPDCTADEGRASGRYRVVRLGEERDGGTGQEQGKF
jgi:hypothetical protein